MQSKAVSVSAGAACAQPWHSVVPNKRASSSKNHKGRDKKGEESSKRNRKKRREEKKKAKEGGRGGASGRGRKRKKAAAAAETRQETRGQVFSRGMPASFEEMLLFNDQLMSQGSDYDAAMAAFITSDQSNSGLWEEEPDESLLLRDFLSGDQMAPRSGPADQTFGPRDEDKLYQPALRAALTLEEEEESFTEIEMDQPETTQMILLGDEANSRVHERRDPPPPRSPKRTRRRNRRFHELYTGRKQTQSEKWHRCSNDCESPSGDEGTNMAQCHNCSGWFHCICQGTSPDELNEQPDLEFLCLRCLEDRVSSLPSRSEASCHKSEANNSA